MHLHGLSGDTYMHEQTVLRSSILYNSGDMLTNNITRSVKEN